VQGDDDAVGVAACEREVVHKAPPLEHIVDAVHGILRVDDGDARARVEVEVWIVADRHLRVDGRQKARRRGLKASELLLRRRQVQAVGHRELRHIRVDIHRTRQCRLQPTLRLVLEPSATHAACAAARDGKAHFGRAAVAARAILVEVAAAAA